VGAVQNLDFTDDELAQIDAYADEESINLWALSSETTEGAAQR
jgi:L-glyceraldehyde 3-phosphate reductase